VGRVELTEFFCSMNGIVYNDNDGRGLESTVGRKAAAAAAVSGFGLQGI